MLMFLNCWRELGDLEQRYAHWEEMQTPQRDPPNLNPSTVHTAVRTCRYMFQRTDLDIN